MCALSKPLFQGKLPKQENDDGAGSGGSAGAPGLSTANSHYVHGHTRKNGSHVAGYYATNATTADNCSPHRNIDPYAGKAGTAGSGRRLWHQAWPASSTRRRNSLASA